MKQVIAALASMSLMFATQAKASSNQLVIIDLKTLPDQSFCLNELTTITPKNDSIIVSSQHFRVSYPAKDVKAFFFVQDAALYDKIDEVRPSLSSSINIERKGDQLIVRGLTVGATLSVFTQSGTHITPKISYTDEANTVTSTINFSNMPKGVYIIKPVNAPNAPSFKFLNL